MQAQENFSVLLVDDDLSVIRILNRILRGFTPIRFAASGREALKLARESIPDLMLLDIDMPEMSGFEVCKAFKADAQIADVPIVFITSHDSPQLQALGLELGAVDFINKPLHPPLVVARVHTYQRLKALSDTLSGTLRSAVTMDFLTGAVTRRQLEKALAKEWLRAERSGASVSLLLADIDGFTAYNGEFGDEKGDACLKSVADVLRSMARRPADVLGRYAGGQFGLLMGETDAQGACTVAQRAIDAVDELQILHAASTGKHRRVTLTVGGGCRRSSRSDLGNDTAGAVPSNLIAVAEHALKSARSAGGHQVRFIDMAQSGAAKATSAQS